MIFVVLASVDNSASSQGPRILFAIARSEAFKEKE